jgi:rhamnogalacturonan hydrolase
MLLAIPLLLFFGVATGQLIGPVGPKGSLADKTIECNILHYGAIADNKTDVSTAFERTFNECVRGNPGSRLVVPQGEYLLSRSVVLSNGTNWALQLDGLITAAYGGNWTVDRELILQGYAGVQALNSTINGEGDGEFLLDVFVIVNGRQGSKFRRDNQLISAFLLEAVDFEFYSSTGRGAFQGQGYIYRNSNK